MAIEKKWPAVPPRLFTTNGGTTGLVTCTDTSGFKVKQNVVIQSTSLPPIQLQVKRVLSLNTMMVGHGTAPLVGPKSQVDISAYTVAQGAFVYAGEQDKATLTPADIIQSVYRQEPGTTIGVEIDDQFGNPISPSNPLPVQFTASGGITPNVYGDVQVAFDANSNPIKYSFYSKTVLQGYITVSYDVNGNPTNYQGYDINGNPL